MIPKRRQPQSAISLLDPRVPLSVQFCHSHAFSEHFGHKLGHKSTTATLQVFSGFNLIYDTVFNLYVRC